MVPVLVLIFKVDLRYAVGASLISVIATSSGAAVAYVKRFLDIRIGMFLEVATTLRPILEAYLTAKISSHYIAVIFGAVLLYSSYSPLRSPGCILCCRIRPPARSLLCQFQLRSAPHPHL